MVNKNQAPRSVTRVDSNSKGTLSSDKPHVHFSDKTALNYDGTVHDRKTGFMISRGKKPTGWTALAGSRR